jgi:hypothetical protein
MDDTHQPRPFEPSSYSQMVSLRNELEAVFAGTVAVHCEGGTDGQSNLILARLYRESSPIRDATLALYVRTDRCVLRFSTIESVGNLSDAKIKLVAQIAYASQKSGLPLEYHEGKTYALSAAERELVKSLIPESYRKKIEGLGIDWKDAQ